MLSRVYYRLLRLWPWRKRVEPAPYSIHEFLRQQGLSEEEFVESLRPKPCIDTIYEPVEVDWAKIRAMHPDLPWNEAAFGKGDDQC